MKPIILITSCAHQLAKNDECRRTWLRRWCHLIDYKFVLSSRTAHLPKCEDELFLDVDDTYYGLPEKVQASHKWALDHGYDWILKTDCDMYVHIPRLLESLSDEDQRTDYIGNFYWEAFALGGSYWLNKRASEYLVNTELPRYGADGGDDVWVGQIMHKMQHHLFLHDPQYVMGNGQRLDWMRFISLHTSAPKIAMEDVHKKVLELE